MAAPDARAQIQRVLGLDISAWQGNISQTTWNNLHTVENRQFIILRSSRGGTTGYYDQNDASNANGLNTFSQRYDDPYYIQNINRVTAAGMFAGSYHFTRPDIIESTLNSGGIRNSGADEADHFIQMAGPWMRPGYLVPIHDFEAGDGIRTDNDMAQFCIDFANRIYQVMGIRPGIYINGNYAGNILQNASASLRDQLAKPPPNLPTNRVPSVVSPCYPYLWSARWPNQTDPNSIDVQGTEPKDTYSGIYGPWDDYGVAQPWKFWQYASTLRLQSYNNGGSNLDADAAHGGLEFLKDQLIPAVWMNDSSGDWSTLANWNSGQTPIQPVPGPGQVAPAATGPLPTPRLPGASGSGPTSGQYDTVILERPNANIMVTLSSGAYNVRKLYMREALNITGGSLTVNYVPSADSTTNGAQFSGPVTLSGSGNLSVHTLQVDNTCTFTLAGGALTLNTISLMPSSTSPAKILISGDVSLSPLSDAAALIANGGGSGNSGFLDLNGATRTLNISNGAADADLSIGVPITNGGLTKIGTGTLAVNSANTFSAGTAISAGRLLVNNASGSGTGPGVVLVTGGTLAGMGSIAGAVIVNSSGTIAPGTSSALGALTLNSIPVLNGTNLVRIDRNNGSSISDRLILTAGTLQYGGSLVVSNVGATLAGGEVFTNFTATAYSGAFSATLLPALSANLNWDLGNLTVNGTIRVNRKPTVTGVTVVNTPGQVLQIPIASLIGSGTDGDGDLLSLTTFDSVTTNGVALSADSTFIYYSNNVNVADRFSYTLSDGRGGNATGFVQIEASSETAPWIAAGPDSITAIAGQDVTFTVNATGLQPLGFVWRFNGFPIAGATASAYTRTNVQVSDAGSYSVVLTNNLGTNTSSDAVLTVNFALIATAGAGGTVSRNPSLASYTPGSTVTVTATPDAGYAFTGWSGDAGGPVNPLDVTLATNISVSATFVQADLILDNTNPAVTFSGTWQTGTASSDKYGTDYRFASVVAAGLSNATYRPSIPVAGYYDVSIWFPQGGNRSTNAPWSVVYHGGSTNVAVNQQANGGAWRVIAPAVPFASGTNGYVRLSNNTDAGVVVLADAVRITYAAPIDLPTITAQPQSVTVAMGSNATFTVSATGLGPLGYQWRLNGTDLSGATASSYTRNDAQLADAGSYSVSVSNIAGTVYSGDAVLTVVPPVPPAIDWIGVTADGHIQLQGSGAPGHYSLEASTNFTDWAEVTNFTTTNSVFEYIDLETNLVQRFFRARLRP